MTRLRGQAGAVALISTIIVAVLISIITVSLADVLTTEQRQTTDVHDSERAYYAADAGVEDALARIRHFSDLNCVYEEGNATDQENGQATLSDLAPGQPCLYTGPGLSTDPSTGIKSLTGVQFDDPTSKCSAITTGLQLKATRVFSENGVDSACWTKRTITRAHDQFLGDLVADNDVTAIKQQGAYSVAVDMTNPIGGTADGVKYIDIAWQKTNYPSGPRCNLNSDKATDATSAPLLEATLVSFTANSDGSGEVLKPIQRGFLLPHSGTQNDVVGQTNNGCDGTPAATAHNWYAGDLPIMGTSNVPAPGDNFGPVGHHCSGNASDLNNLDVATQYCVRLAVPSKGFYILRLRNKFNINSYKVTAYDSAFTQVHLSANYTDISVTGRAGDVYRRLIVRKQLGADVFSVFDFVLFSEEDLNKNLRCIDISNPASCT